MKTPAAIFVEAALHGLGKLGALFGGGFGGGGGSPAGGGPGAAGGFPGFPGGPAGSAAPFNLPPGFEKFMKK